MTHLPCSNESQVHLLHQHHSEELRGIGLQGWVSFQQLPNLVRSPPSKLNSHACWHLGAANLLLPPKPLPDGTAMGVAVVHDPVP